jgi:hypothetical protein
LSVSPRRLGSLVAAIVFDLVAVAHLLRLLFHTQVVVGTWVVPMWVSVVGFIAAALLSILLFLEARPKAP